MKTVLIATDQAVKEGRKMIKSDDWLNPKQNYRELWFVSQRGQKPHIVNYDPDYVLCGARIHRDGFQVYTYPPEQVCINCIRKGGYGS